MENRFAQSKLSRRNFTKALVQAKRRYDPDNVFASGPDIFREQKM
jgi:hypothetical protein